jgi:SAM-dependent methyltransferase
MKETGIGTEEYFATHYRDRDWKRYRQILARIVEFSLPGPILDLGAGVGFFVECAGRWGMDCTGVEGALSAVRIATGRYPKLAILHHTLENPLPFKDKSFQTVLMNQVVEHLTAPTARRCLNEVNRVLRPGGMLLITSPSKYNLAESRGDPTHVLMYSPKELRNLLASCGFTGIIPMDSPLSILGKNYFARGIMFLLFKLTQWDRLSATANCMAYKIDESRG